MQIHHFANSWVHFLPHVPLQVSLQYCAIVKVHTEVHKFHLAQLLVPAVPFATSALLFAILMQNYLLQLLLVQLHPLMPFQRSRWSMVQLYRMCAIA
jgi:hypothetical protein